VGWTKQQLLNQAFGALGKSVNIFNIDPDTMQDALRSMDAMLATWNGKGIRLGYSLPSSPENSNLDDDSGLPDSAFEAVYQNTAIRIAPFIGKEVSQDLKNSARAAYDVLLARAAMPDQQQMPNTMPRGAGNKPWRMRNGPFMPPPVDQLEGSAGDTIEFD